MSRRSVAALLLLQGTVLVGAKALVLPTSRDEAQRIHGWGPALLRRHFPNDDELLEKVDGPSDNNLGKSIEGGPLNNNLDNLQDPLNKQEEFQPTWAAPQNACINSPSKKFLTAQVLSLEECKTRCIEDTDIVCHSVGYITSTRSCSLSWETSSSANFMMPCDYKNYTYVERNFGDATESTAPLFTDLVDERSHAQHSF